VEKDSRLERARKFLIGIDADMDISEEVRVAKMLRATASMNWLAYQEHLRVGFTAEQALQIIVALISLHR
jgi:hypothetical protein